jgi:hypothetical protein
VYAALPTFVVSGIPSSLHYQSLTINGIVAWNIYEGSVNKEQFIDFLRNDLVRYNGFAELIMTHGFIGTNSSALSNATKCCYNGQLLNSS